MTCISTPLLLFSISAPEIQTNSNCSILSDMFSLGMVVCAIFNNGKTLIQAQNTPSAYLKQLELVSVPLSFSHQNQLMRT
jgi:hypothetical protein